MNNQNFELVQKNDAKLNDKFEIKNTSFILAQPNHKISQSVNANSLKSNLSTNNKINNNKVLINKSVINTSSQAYNKKSIINKTKGYK